MLGLLNFSYETRFMGRDVLQDGPARARAFISTYQKLGFLEGNRLVVLGPQKYLKSFSVDPVTGRAVETPTREATLNAAIAYFQGASYFYTNRSNRLLFRATALNFPTSFPNPKASYLMKS